ncbi:MAG TPA: HEPN domain-containing protein [Deltaproteobacteria bacterium]|nr:HEPN domain-containing protein [Deltaproteobacteria bacterium]
MSRKSLEAFPLSAILLRVMEREGVREAREWLRRARSSLLKAKACLEVEGVVVEDLCFDLHQAAERALKAYLLFLQRTPPPLHDLEVVLAQIAREGIPVPERVRGVSRLNRYYALVNHPKLQSRVTRADYYEALDLAEETIRWVEEEMVDREKRG